jgi:hypothetical protein
MEEYSTAISSQTEEGALLRAVLAVRNDQYRTARYYIDKVRSLLDGELTAMLVGHCFTQLQINTGCRRATIVHTLLW